MFRLMFLPMPARHSAIVLLWMALLTQAAWAGPGMDAYQAGDYKRALAILEPQAQLGISEAQFLLGRMRESGQGIEANRERAVFWYRKAAAQRHFGASAALEAMGESKTGTLSKPLTGVASGPQSAATGSGSASSGDASLSDTARLLAMLEGRAAWDRVRGPQLIETLKRRAETGDAESAATLGMVFETPPAGAPDLSTAARWYARAVELKHPLAANNLGALHYDGRGVAQDFAEAARLYRIGADGGSAIAQYNLAVMLGQGRAGNADVPQMIDWMKKSAAQGYARAQAQLARFYLDGLGVDKDAVEAGRLFLAAAQAGHVNAQYWYGQLSASGNGVSRELSVGADWILRAADAGLPIAMQEAGAIFELGLGRNADSTRAVSYYKRAGDAGVKEAAARLASAYANGELGLPQDTNEAARWSLRAK